MSWVAVYYMYDNGTDATPLLTAPSYFLWKVAELGTRQNCRDNVIMFLGLMSIFGVTSPFRHPCLNILRICSCPLLRCYVVVLSRCFFRKAKKLSHGQLWKVVTDLYGTVSTLVINFRNFLYIIDWFFYMYAQFLLCYYGTVYSRVGRFWVLRKVKLCVTPLGAKWF